MPRRVKQDRSNLETIKSARALAQAWRQQHVLDQSGSSPRKLRLDSAQSAGPDNVREIENREAPKFVTLEEQSLSIASARNAISFGLFVFLLGHALMLGAFLVSHWAAGAIGMLLSLGGITVSLLSVNEALRRLDGRSTPTNKPTSQN
jgi:hypothetical protein